jgi:hypothetical protein
MAPVIPSSCSFVMLRPLGSLAGEEDWDISPEETAEEPGGVDDSFKPSICETAWRREECLAGVKSRLAICDGNKGGDKGQPRGGLIGRDHPSSTRWAQREGPRSLCQRPSGNERESEGRLVECAVACKRGLQSGLEQMR